MASGRSKAKTWPYPRHRHFRREVETAASAWFAERDLAVRPKTAYVLAHRDDWAENIIDADVVRYIYQTQKERSKQKRVFRS